MLSQGHDGAWELYLYLTADGSWGDDQTTALHMCVSINRACYLARLRYHGGNNAVFLFVSGEALVSFLGELSRLIFMCTAQADDL